MKTLLATTAIALLMVGTANAQGPLVELEQENTNIAVGVGKGYGGGGGGGGGGGNATINQEEPKRMLGQAPAIVLAQPGVGAAAAKCVIGGGTVRGRAIGLGVGTGANSVPSAGLGYAYTLSDGLLDTQCAIYNASNGLMNVGLGNAAQKVTCLDKIARVAIEATTPGFCDGVGSINEQAVNTFDAAFTMSPASQPVVASAPQPVAAVEPAKPDFASCQNQDLGPLAKRKCLNNAQLKVSRSTDWDNLVEG